MKYKIIIFLFLIVSVFIVFNEDKQDHNQYSLDPGGYYLYLPAFFIYHDIMVFNFYPVVNDKYHCGALVNPVSKENNKKIDKYSIGVSFFELPLFLVAHFYCRFTNQYVADGYTLPYQLAGIFSNILWVVLGLLVLGHHLRKRYSDSVVALTLICIAFGTNLFTYSSFILGMSHPYSFFLFSCLIHVTDNMFTYPRKKWSGVVLGIILGFIFIVRPVNILIITFPLLVLLSYRNASNSKQLSINMAFAIVPFFMIVFVQLFYWKYITGNWLYYSYPGEGFNFLHSNIVNGLFSYRKGWFVYTPMALVSFAGFYFLWKKDQKITRVLLVVFVLFIYVIFSWRQWWYGGGFGCRPLIEMYSFCALLLAPLIGHFYDSARKAKKIVLISILFALVTLNIFQSYQYSTGLIHWSRMTKAYYWKVFGVGNFGKDTFDRVKNEKYLMSEEEENKYSD